MTVKTRKDPLVRFWIAYKYTTIAIDRVELLSIGMITTDEAKLRAFAQEHGWKVESAVDGEMFPV